MYCPNCKKEVIGDICEICGYTESDEKEDDGIVYFDENDRYSNYSANEDDEDEYDEDEDDEDEDEDDEDDEDEDEDEDDTKSSNGLLKGIVAFSCVALIGAVIVGVFSSSSSSNRSTDSETDSVNAISEVREGIKEIKDGVESIKEDIKKDIAESPVGQIKEGIDDIKEIVDDVKDINAIINDEARAPMKSKKCKGKNYLEVEEAFEDAGFTDIVLKADKDLKVGLLHDDGDVESVTIGGNDKFDEGDKFSSDDEVIITYHTYPD